MTAAGLNGQRQFRRVAGIETEIWTAGAGEPLLILPWEAGLMGWPPYAAQLAHHYRVIIPSLPGYGGTARPEDFETVDDLAYFCLDLLDELQLTGVHLLGCSFGGWVAAEVAIRCQCRLKSLMLVGALGIKAGGREVAEIADFIDLRGSTLAPLYWGDPARHGTAKVIGAPDLTEAETRELLSNVESTTRYGWKPFMHNPRLLARLHRIQLPTLVVWGAEDRLTRPEYGQAYAAAISGARFVPVPDAGHAPHEEQLERFMEICRSFFQPSGRLLPAGGKE